ncbi:NAD(P)-dependent oxidoreductase [Halegenticoccus tardaugens]|uniref:NAD(P)-dependent oxidoreductase n=1 Tax=Halegenticoccus tardaugens TaxID=2071624 RepID=UPI00100B4C78|nr:NAD(P)H-binding protein [Halegenticoccus tardaugens]
MNVALFGADGRTGRRLLLRLLDVGHEVTALTRSPARLPDRSNLRTMRGDVRDTALVREAVRRQDAVVSALDGLTDGAERVPVVSTGTANVVDGMRATDVGRLVVVTGAGILQSPAGRLRLDDPLCRSFHPELEAEHRKVYDTLSDTGLAWTAVCAPTITDDGAIGEYRTAVETLPEGGTRISADDLAAFVAAHLDERYVGKRVGISY